MCISFPLDETREKTHQVGIAWDGTQGISSDDGNVTASVC